MSAPAKVNVALSAEMNELVQQAIATGEYATNSDVIGEALQEWSLRRQLKISDKTALLGLWDEGLASGPGAFNNMDGIKGEAQRRREASLVKGRV